MREPGGHEAPITAVVITRDRCRVLARSLERLTALPGRPRVIVVDNGSSDDTVRTVRERFPTVDLIALERNRGASARNVGVGAAQTPYVAFSDDDSWWAEGALQRAAELLDTNPRLALIAATILVGASERLDPTCALMADSPLKHPPGLPGHPVLGFLACGAVVRRSAFEAVGGFQLRQGVGGEEQLLAVDLAEAGHDLAYVPEVCAHHHPPQPGGDGGSRRSDTMRNDLWFAWLRRSLGSSIAQTGSLAASALFDAQARAALTGAIRGAPPVLAARRPVKRELELQLRLLDRAAREP